jgi:hypothetical protein
LDALIVDINHEDVVIFSDLNIIIIMYEGTVDKSSCLYDFLNTFEVINIGKNSRPNIKLYIGSSMG